MNDWIPIEEAKLELWGIYWIKIDEEVLTAPAKWIGNIFSGGGWPLSRDIVTHVMKITKPEA